MEISHSSESEQLDLFDPNGYSSNKFQGFSLPTETPSGASWLDCLEQMLRLCPEQGTGNGKVRVWCPQQTKNPMVLPGSYEMLNISECPNAAVESSLSAILETGNLPQRYYLSREACAGILRRAAKRGKALPLELERELKRVAEHISDSNLGE